MRRLLHPAYLLALGLLLTNDRLVKAAWPGAISGKLSDFAGLIVLSVLLCVLFQVWDRRRAWGIHLSVGVLFAALQFVRLDGLFSALGLVLVHTPDPTDIVALAVLPIGVALSVRRPEPTGLWRPPPTWRGQRPRRVTGAVLALSVVAILGTSQPLTEIVDEPLALRSAETAETADAAYTRVESALRQSGVHVEENHRQNWDPGSRRDAGDGELREYTAGILHACSTPADTTVVAPYHMAIGWDPKTQGVLLVRASLFAPCQPEPIGGASGEDAWRELFRLRVVALLQTASGDAPGGE